MRENLLLCLCITRKIKTEKNADITHELSWVQTYDPIVQVEKSVHALECTTIVIGLQNHFAGMEISSTQCWSFSNGDS
jgi:hypothetical protein